MAIKMRVLITVKTYPLPSRGYQEIVCTAGVQPDGTFIRLNPIDYRYRPYWQWYKKYQWVDVEVEKHDKDPRKESFRPKLETLKPYGEPLDTKNNWQERKKYVLAKGAHSMEELNIFQDLDRTSLGITRPKEIFGLDIDEVERDWKPEWKTLFLQQRLFGPQQKPLEKIPYRFSYRFACDDSRCNGNHKLMIEDWEICELFLRMRNMYQDEKVALDMVRNKFYNEICGSKIDTHFFVGTTLQYGTWIILGVFWPKKQQIILPFSE